MNTAAFKFVYENETILYNYELNWTIPHFLENIKRNLKTDYEQLSDIPDTSIEIVYFSQMFNNTPLYYIQPEKRPAITYQYSTDMLLSIIDTRNINNIAFYIRILPEHLGTTSITYSKECPICFSIITQSSNMSILQCSHRFCNVCLERCRQSHIVNCPMCRSSM